MKIIEKISTLYVHLTDIPNNMKQRKYKSKKIPSRQKIKIWNFCLTKQKLVHFFWWGEPNRCSLFFCWCLYGVVIGGCCFDYSGELEGLRAGEGEARRYTRLSRVLLKIYILKQRRVYDRTVLNHLSFNFKNATRPCFLRRL